jgi:hypothetical protein
METSASPISTSQPFTIATISAGFEKGDFLVREEQGARIYFDFVSTLLLPVYMHPRSEMKLTKIILLCLAI